MKRHIRIASLVAALSLYAVSAPTTAANGDFTLTVNVTPSCLFGTNALTLNYTSFQTSATNTTAAVTANCTTGQVYRLTLASASGSAITLGGDNITYSGTTVGLNYTLRIQNGAGDTDINTTAFQTGNGAVGQNYTIRGVIAANQEGTCTADAANTPGAAICATATETKTIVATF